MAETRILRERKKAVNYNEDAEERRAQRKITDLVGERRGTRNNKPSGATDKENQRKRQRTESRSLRDSDTGGSGDSDGPSRPPAKRAKSPAREDEGGSDAIEDSDDGDNVFINFARPGKRPAPAAKPQGRPGRAAAARASRRISDAAAARDDDLDDGDEEDVRSVAAGRDGGRPTRQAAATAKARLRRGGAGAKGRRRAIGMGEDDSEAMEVEDEEEEKPGRSRPMRNAAATAKERLQRGRGTTAGPKGNRRPMGMTEDDPELEDEEDDDEEQEGEDVDAGAGRARSRGGATDIAMVDDSGSESDDEADDDDDDEDMEEAEDVAPRKKAPVNKAGAAGGRPTRKCVARTAARAAANANAPKGRPRQEAASESDDSESSDGEEDSSDGEEEDEDVVIVRGKAATVARGGRRRAPARGKTASTNPASDDDDDDEEDEEEDDEEEDDDEEEAQEEGDGAARGSGDSEDSDVKLVDDDEEEDEDAEEDGSDNAGEGSEDEEQEEVPAQRGGPLKGETKASRAAAAGKGKAGAKGKAGVVAKGKAAKGKGEQGGKGKGAVKEKDSKASAPSGGKKYAGPVEKILSYDSEAERYHVKLEGVSYRNTIHVSQSYLEKAKPQLLRMFLNRGVTVEVDRDWLLVDRVIASRTVNRGRQGPAKQLLVKWRGLEYTDSTWEYEEDLSSEADQAAIARFKRSNKPAGTGCQHGADNGGGNEQALRQPNFELPTFCSGRSLRDYQQVSVRWMVNNYTQRRNCILGDEMGLGKTAQSISTLQTLRAVGGVPGPFLVVAPLSTLGHWQREIETWTDMNVVLLAGSAADRALIVEHEFYRPSSSASAGGSRSGGGSGSSTRGREIKFNVLLVSYDTLLKERFLLRSLSWSAAVFDEAHRLKGLTSSTRAAVEEMDIDWLLLLTGTPIQNNMLELYSILSLLDPDGYPSPEDFTSRFGGATGGPPPTVGQIRALQAALAPVLLRRMKEDVEELPQKEEVVVWVELTAAQRAYYRALYEGQIGALLGGASSKNLPSMRNLAMELRKLCCHPVLCEGLEDDLKHKLAAQRSLAPPGAPQEFNCPEVELLVRGSGKMVLLHKLLHKLRAEGRRVLIFSQFVIMLNVLEDYCNAVGFPVERIDGTVKGRDRQQAIDRFSAEGEGSDGAFVFLLSTRAGGQGITLTAADTCIIYDSDWNPQNDLQAMARCHRIGQKKEVTVYRLISRDTYEMALFNSASKKYGLDEAILGFSGGSDPESDSARIAELLRHGAHGLLADMEAGLKQGEAFASEDINQILAARTEKRQIGSRAGNTFSVATFAADDDAGGAPRGGRRKRARRASGDGEDSDDDGDGADEEQPAGEDYWRALMPEAVAAHEAKAAEGPVYLGPRKRKQVNYNLNDKKYNPKLASDDSESDAEGRGAGAGENAGAEGTGGEAGGKKRRGRARKDARAGSAEAAEGGQEGGQAGAGQEGAVGGKGRGRKAAKPTGAWTKLALKALEDRLISLGPDRWDELYEQLQPCKYSATEVEAAARAMWELYGIASGLAAERKAAAIAALNLAASAKLGDDIDDSLDLLVGGAAARPAPAAGAAVGPSGAGGAEAAAGGAATGNGASVQPPSAPAVQPAQAAQPPPADKVMDEYEEKMAKAILEKAPETLHGALAGPAPIKRLLKEGADNVKHGRAMQELARLMRPAAAADGTAGAASPTAAAAGSSSATAVNGLRACYMPPPTTAGNFLGWWGRADDEALLAAAAQVGYGPGKPSRTVDHALRNQPLLGRVVQKPEPEQDPQQQPKDGGDAAGKQEAAAGVEAEAAAPPAAAKSVDAEGDQVMAEAGDKQQAAPAAAAAPAAPRAPGPNGPLQLSADEWRIMVNTLSRRLGRLITSTLDFHRKLKAAQSGRQPLVVSKPSRPSAPPPPSREAATAAAGASRPSSGAAPPAAAAPAAAPVAANAAAAPLQPATIATVVKNLVVAAANAIAARGVSGGNEQVVVAKPPAADAAQQPPQPQPQPQQQAADPHRRTPGEANPRAAAPSAAAAGQGSKSAGQKKQSTLPFARLGGSGSNKNTTPGAAAAGGEASARVKKPPQVVAAAAGSPHKAQALVLTVVGKAAATPAALAAAAVPADRAARGSAEKPIEVGDSD